MRLPVHFCGPIGALLEAGSTDWSAHRIDMTKVTADFPPHVLVLVPESLSLIHPGRLLGWLQAGRRTLLVCGETWPLTEMSRWIQLLDGRCVAPSSLKSKIDEAVARHRAGLVRRHVEPASWLPPLLAGKDGRFLERAATELTRLAHVHDVDGWADACGVSYSTLHRRIKDATGWSPSDLALAYVDAYHAVARRAGDDPGDIVAALGYADSSAVAHARARARRRRAKRADAPR